MLATLFILALLIGPTVYHNDVLNEKVSDYGSDYITIEKNVETGLTDITLEEKTFSLDIQPVDPSKFNN